MQHGYDQAAATSPKPRKKRRACKTITVLALAASLGAIGISPSEASGTKSVGTGWNDTNANAAQDRANLIENVLTPAAVTKVKHLRSIIAPVAPPTAKCRTQSIVSPLPAGGYLYAVTDGKVSKYNPATGHLIWQHSPPAPYAYSSLAISGLTNTLIASANDCTHPNDLPGIVTAYNATTGKQIWSNTSLAGLVGEAPVEVFGSYVIVAGLDRDGGFRWVLNLSDGTTVWSNDGCNDDNNPILPGPGWRRWRLPHRRSLKAARLGTNREAAGRKACCARQLNGGPADARSCITDSLRAWRRA